MSYTILTMGESVLEYPQKVGEIELFLQPFAF